MSRKYVVTIRDLSDKLDSDIVVKGVNPMEVHKAAFMSTKPNEEIMAICDESNEIVYDLKGGFRRSY